MPEKEWEGGYIWSVLPNRNYSCPLNAAASSSIKINFPYSGGMWVNNDWVVQGSMTDLGWRILPPWHFHGIIYGTKCIKLGNQVWLPGLIVVNRLKRPQHSSRSISCKTHLELLLCWVIWQPRMSSIGVSWLCFCFFIFACAKMNTSRWAEDLIIQWPKYCKVTTRLATKVPAAGTCWDSGVDLLSGRLRMMMVIALLLTKMPWNQR